MVISARIENSTNESINCGVLGKWQSVTLINNIFILFCTNYYCWSFWWTQKDSVNLKLLKTFFSHMCDYFLHDILSKGNMLTQPHCELWSVSLHHYVINQFIWLLQSATPLLFLFLWTLLLYFPTISSMHHTAPPFSLPPASLFLRILCHLLSQLSAYIVFVLAENSHFVSGGNCVFLCSARLSFFSCMFSMLAKLPLPACSRECAPSAAVP